MMVDEADFPRPILTIDVILLTLGADGLRVGLVRRAAAPFAGRLALIGGYVHVQEDKDAEGAARRILAAKAGLRSVYLEQLQTFSGPRRDPRGWAATVAYYGLCPPGDVEGASELVFRSADDPGPLAFDHADILKAALARLRAKGAYSTLPAFLLAPAFTLSQLHDAYQRAMGEPINESAFRRKIAELDFLERIEGEFSRATDRPAALYRLRARGLQAFDRRIKERSPPAPARKRA